MTTSFQEGLWTALGAGIPPLQLLGWGKKGETVAQQQAQQQTISPVIQPVVTVTPVITQPNYTNTNTYQNTYDYSRTNNIISESPGSSIVSKKQISPASTVIPSASWNTPFTTSQQLPTSIIPSQSASQTATTGSDNLIWIAAIIVLGVIGYGVVSKPSKQATVAVSRKELRGAI